jgi:hypothetical protein
MIAQPNRHGVYVDHDDLRLMEGKTRIALAEIRVAETPGGWRAATSFMFTTGNWWGSSSPITDRDPAFASRNGAVSHAASVLTKRLSDAPRHAVEPTMEGQRKKIIAWLASLMMSEPQQLDLNKGEG